MMRMQFSDTRLSATWMATGLVATALILAGCAGGPHSHVVDARYSIQALTTPAFLTSPAMALMTNTDGFVAHVDAKVVENRETNSLSGRLFGRGTRLLFVPDTEKHFISKRRAAEQTTYSWDVSESKGYVFNEALQGYAPIASADKITGVEVKDMEAVYENIDGHRCQRGTATITTTVGTKPEFSVWRATDLKGLPLQIKSANGQITCTFSKVAFERIGTEVFLPPDGFTAHASPDSMLSSLLERQANARKKSPDTEFSEDNMPPQPGPSARSPR